MSQRNLTLSIDDELIERIKLVAARRRTSVSGLVRDLLADLVRRDEAFEAARASALRRLRRGARLGGGELPSRDEIHQRGPVR